MGHVPDSVWANTELETLVLAGNDLTSLSPKAGLMTGLRMLDLGHNLLTEVPAELGEIEGLSDFLYLHDNRLSSLPSSLARLTKLRYLNISENRFEELPNCVCEMGGLIELRASDNQLQALPESTGGLSRLRELHLRNNRLITLPEALCGLRELRQLDLRGNPLVELPECLTFLPRLDKLDLRWVTTLTSWAIPEQLEASGCTVYR